MFPTLERPRITEIQVRIDCNGCVQKIKKALHGINGIYDVYIDLPQQKLAIVGWADPEKIIKAIKKARKTATIYSHCEVQDPLPTHPMDQPLPPPPLDPSNPLADPPPPDQSYPPQPEPPRGQQPPPPQHPPCGPNNSHHHPPPRVVEEVHVIHNEGHGPWPPGYNSGLRGPGPSSHSQEYGPRPPCYNLEPPDRRLERLQHVHVVHNYNQHRPPAYVTQYEYVPSQPRYAPYYGMDNYNNNNGDYQNDNNNNGYPTSMFNEENPNACKIC